MSTRRSPTRLGPTALGEVLDGTRQVALRQSRAALDRHTWKRAVGRRIAERTEVGSLRGGELTIYVASAAWAQELSLLTREILERLKSHGVRAERVRFRVRAELGTPKEQPAPARGRRPAPPLPNELSAKLAHVADDGLRDAITEAAALALARLARGPAPERTRVTSATPAARNLRGAAKRSAPPDRSSAASHADPRRKRVKS